MYEELLTVKEASARLRCSPSTIYTAVATGQLPHYRVGTGRGHIRIHKDDLETYWRSCRRGGEGKPVSPDSPGETRPGAFKILDAKKLKRAWESESHP